MPMPLIHRKNGLSDLDDMFAAFGAQSSLIVAYSGGADSTALLLMALEAAPGRVSAVHVHHGLQAAADDFALHCEAFCAERGVPIAVLRVNAQAASGQSPEDAARKARYHAISAHVLKQKQPQALIKSAPSAHDLIANRQVDEPIVLLAQHADDQVETLLLALSRGAGVDGLSGMAARFERHGLQWGRPFLSEALFMGSQEIRQWLQAKGLQARQPGDANLGQGWVEDPTNQSLQFTRNRIRAQLLPALAQVFPQYRQTFARSARNMAQALELLALSATQLEASIGLPPRITSLQTLAPAQQSNYLRHWLKTQHHTAGSEAQMQELLSQIKACTTRGHSIRIKLGAGFVLREGEVLRFEAAAG
jgi:tRNA(Ile)-lysidine synthase